MTSVPEGAVGGRHVPVYGPDMAVIRLEQRERRVRSWSERITRVGLLSLLASGCAAVEPGSAVDEMTGVVPADVTVDVAEEVSGTSVSDSASSGVGSDGVARSTVPASPDPVTISPSTTAVSDSTSAPVSTTPPVSASTGSPATAVTSPPVTSPVTSAVTSPVTSPSRAVDGPVVSAITALLDGLPVAPEPSRSGYDRDLFPHWSDTNGSGCDARQDTLAAQVLGLPQVDLFDRCVIVEGDWYSIYDGVTHAGSPSELDVDHVVSLAEAWDSGASAWDRDRRRAFANDPRHLLAVTASSNRSKGDRDLGEWRPAQRSAWCVTATMTVEAKAAYGLSVDAAERSAIAEMLALCGQPDQVSVGQGAAAPVPASSAPATTTAAAQPTTTPPPPAAEEASPGCIDINTAGVVDLDRIVHIGPSRAEEMLTLRPFASVADMERITGIGASRLADIVAEGLACVP